MKSVLVIAALILMALVFQRITPTQTQDALSQTRQHDIVVLSTGRGFDRAVIGDLSCIAAIRFDNMLFEHNRSSDGLWLMTIESNGSYTPPRSYDIHHDPSAIADFIDWVQGASAGQTFVMAVSRSIEFPSDPRIQAALPQIDTLFSQLGTDRQPHRKAAFSWSLITQKTSSGWQALAESSSDYRGVTLNYTLDATPAAKPWRQHDRSPPVRSRTHVFDYFGAASDMNPIPVFMATDALAFGDVDSFAIEENATNDSSFIEWDLFTVGDHSFIQYRVTAVHTSGPPRQVVFDVSVNDESVGQHAISSHTDLKWAHWQTHLTNTPPGRISLRLSCKSTDGTPLPRIHWGDVVLETDR